MGAPGSTLAGGAGAGELLPTPVPPPDPVGMVAGTAGDGAAVTVVPGEPLTAPAELGPFELARTALGVPAPGAADPVGTPPGEVRPPRSCAPGRRPSAATSPD